MPLLDKKPLIRGGGGGSRHLEASMSDPGAPLVGILGTGDFSRSLARRLVASGYQLVVGSRNPKRSVALFPEEAEVTTQMEAASQARLVFVALFPEHYSTLAGLKEPLAGKVLVDVSNSVRLNLAGPSNAELLADMFPESSVVKAFNTVSAWTLQMGAMDGSRQVLLCGDSRQSKEAVAQVCRSAGFLPVDAGLLSVSLEVENQPLHLFPSWRVPVLTTLALFTFFYLYNFAHGVLHPFVTKGERHFHKMPIDTVNVTLPSVALVLLSLVYLPGLLAAGLQLRRGTKYSRFPAWLDRWLLRRKQLGLCSFACAVLHAVYSLAIPMTRSHRYGLLNDAYKQVKAGPAVSWDEEQVWRMELYVSVGIMALGVLSLLAVSSLPTVSNSLNWREFSFIQSSLGYVALVLGTLHTLLFGWDRAFDGAHYHFYLPPTFMLVLALPCAVLLGRGALALPCAAPRLARIRRGWEEKSGRHIRFAMPGGGGGSGCNGQSLEDMTDV